MALSFNRRQWASYAIENKPSNPAQSPPIRPYQRQPRIPQNLPKPGNEGPAKPEPKDPARGVEAMMRVVREGKLDDRYKPAARKVTALICALPILIYTSYVLFQRRFMGVEQKRPVLRGAGGAEERRMVEEVE